MSCPSSKKCCTSTVMCMDSVAGCTTSLACAGGQECTGQECCHLMMGASVCAPSCTAMGSTQLCRQSKDCRDGWGCYQGNGALSQFGVCKMCL
jgi:hypothetical protein